MTRFGRSRVLELIARVWAKTPGALRETIIALMLFAVIVPPFNALLAYNSRFLEADVAALRVQVLRMIKEKSDRQKLLAAKTLAEPSRGPF